MAQTVIDVPTIIDQQKVSAFQIRVAALCAAVVFMDGFDAQAIGYVAPTLARVWALKPGELGPVFAAGLFGLMIGALFFGPLADRIGRRRVILFCTFFFGLTTLFTVTSGSVYTLLVWRFLTGLGLGGAMPNAIALTSEYSPHRSRATMVMVMFCGFSLGSALGGVVAAKLIPAYGWTAVFWLGGALPLALVPVLMAALPESIRLLALRGDEDAPVREILLRINPALSFAPRTGFTAYEEHPGGFAVRHLFTKGRAVATLLLWVMFFMNLLDLYFLANWLPTVISNAGVSVEIAVIATALLQVGGIVGTLTLGRLIDRWNPFLVLAATYFAAGIFIAAIGAVGASVALMMAITFGAGFCVVGAQIGANALAANFYPTFVRATGVGWALGIGRIGSIVGPLVGGALLAWQWSTPALFLAAAAPAMIAAVAAFLMGRSGRGGTATPTRLRSATGR
jgi:AAHS family 4-hydroxybenzoate transporter-like MFS transporter